MRKYLQLFIFLLAFHVYSQTATGLVVEDTRSTNIPPNQYLGHLLKAEFKLRDVVGVPGTGMYSGMLTLTPWYDNSGNKYHQLNFNDGGLYYRSGLPQDSQWGSWSKVLTTDSNGNFKLFTDGNTSFRVSNSFGSFEIGKSNCNGCYALGAGGTVLRNVGGSHDILLYMPNNNNDGKSFIGFGDDANAIWVKILNNRTAIFDGKIFVKEVQVKANVWSDFVFSKDYKLPSLEKVEKHIIEKGHLPGIPTEKEVLENGINVAEMDASLLLKIEELTLYIIEQDKKIKELEKLINKK